MIWRAGTPPSEGGHPGVHQRVVHADGMLVEYDAKVPMRDGVAIYVDVFRPLDRGPVPVLIAWSPYGKHAPVRYDLFPGSGVRAEWLSRYAGFEGPDPLYWTRHGYAVINVDPQGL